MVLVDGGVGFIKWYSAPSPNLSPYIFLGFDPSPPPLDQTVEEEKKTVVKFQDAERDVYIVRETGTCKERERDV